MKAVTLWQPWASLIVVGAKRIETRNWATRYRGEIAIHAAQKWNRELMAIAAECRCWTGDPGLLPLGAVVATARLTDCLPTESPELAHILTEQEVRLGDYSAGRFAWVLEDVQPLPVPVFCSGAQGLWNWQEFPTVATVLR